MSNSTFIFFNRFFNTLASLLVMYFFAHKLSPNDYGQYQSFWAQLNVFNAIAGIGIAIFAYVYPPEQLIALFRKIKRPYYSVYFLFLICCGLVFAYLQYHKGVSVPYVVLFLAGFALGNIGDAFLIVIRKFRSLIFINVGYALLFFLIHILFLYRVYDLNELLLFLLPLLFLKLACCGFVLFKNRGIRFIEESAGSSYTQDPANRRMFSLWRHMYFFDIIQISFLWLDKFIISLLLNNEQTAIYINGTLNIPFLPILFSAISGGALIHLAANRNKSNQLRAVNQAGRVLSSVAFPLCIFLLFFGKEFIVFFFSEKYVASVPIFMCSVLILPLRAYGHTIILQNLEKGRIINQGAIMDILLAVLLMYPMYLWIGLPGVALSFVISTFFQTFYYLFQTRRLLKARISELFPIGNWAGKIIGFGLLAFVLHYGLGFYHSATGRLFTAASIMGILSAAVLVYEMRRIKRMDQLKLQA